MLESAAVKRQLHMHVRDFCYGGALVFNSSNMFSQAVTIEVNLTGEKETTKT